MFNVLFIVVIDCVFVVILFLFVVICSCNEVSANVLFSISVFIVVVFAVILFSNSVSFNCLADISLLRFVVNVLSASSLFCISNCKSVCRELIFDSLVITLPFKLPQPYTEPVPSVSA